MKICNAEEMRWMKKLNLHARPRPIPNRALMLLINKKDIWSYDERDTENRTISDHDAVNKYVSLPDFKDFTRRWSQGEVRSHTAAFRCSTFKGEIQNSRTFSDELARASRRLFRIALRAQLGVIWAT